jgi:RNA polymerase sigma-70 factor (ECF subfamily)
MERLKNPEIVIEAAKSGDQAAWKELVTAIDQSITVRLRTGTSRLSPEDLEDARQEIYLNLVDGGLEKYDPERGQFNTWISAVAHNKAIDIKIKNSRRDATPLSAFYEDTLGESHDPSPFELAAQNDSAHTLRQAVGTLPPNQNQAVSSVYLRNSTYEDAANHLHLPLGTLKARVHRGLKKLRAHPKIKELT